MHELNHASKTKITTLDSSISLFNESKLTALFSYNLDIRKTTLTK